jgi:hypothetical protein
VLVADSPPNLVDSFWRAVSDDGQHAPPRIEKTKGGWRLRFANLVRGSHTISYQDPMRAIVALNGVVVPDDGPSRDERLARVSLRDGITAIAFHIVDAQDIPIAGARVTGRGFQVWTDGSGKTGFATCAPDATAATIEARGFRPRELPALTDGLRIALAPASTFLVALKGLPADAPRDRLSVWVRSERDNFTGPHVALGIGDATELVAPVNGRYRMHLMIRGAKAGNFVAVCPEAVELAYGTIPPIEWKLDEPALANLRLLTK